MEEALRTSVRRLSQRVELLPATCRNILKKDVQLHPYRLQAVQQLHEADYPVRLEYCPWFLNTLNENLFNLSFFTDETWFYLDGYVNFQNVWWRSSEKPNFFEEIPSHPLKLGVWMPISRRRINAPIIFDGIAISYSNVSKNFMMTKLWTNSFTKTMPLHTK
ncbi:hypothetical protein BDFB_010085, partial [Asbolus verrucosus]